MNIIRDLAKKNNVPTTPLPKMKWCSLVFEKKR